MMHETSLEQLNSATRTEFVDLQCPFLRRVRGEVLPAVVPRHGRARAQAARAFLGDDSVRGGRSETARAAARPGEPGSRNTYTSLVGSALTTVLPSRETR